MILQLRPIFKTLMKFKVGNGQNILLWLDDWHLKGPLLSTYPTRLLFESGISITAKLSHIINDCS